MYLTAYFPSLWVQACFNPGLFHFLWGLGWKKKRKQLMEAGKVTEKQNPTINLSFAFVCIQVH